MDESFRAFTFVDRILSCEPGVKIRGLYEIPAGIESFPASLASEAVGQLAAWSAMAAVDFQGRPVAGIAGSIELLGEVRPGQTLELAVDFESADNAAAAYGGSASVNGIPVVRLTHCVGPMVPMEEFADPAAARARYALMLGKGANPGAFSGLPPLTIERTGTTNGTIARASLQVPPSARIFADHFPRRPVFPGSLLMHASLELAARFTNEIAPAPSGSAWQPRGISDMKLRSFIPPGELLELEARLEESSEREVGFLVETRRGKRLLGSARVGFVLEGAK
jgi:3-hydroxymyristoyl/3-hydroxydecanoyl-(acyl carrier protein) dehydratase